jgi:hypothetical protein
MENLAHGAYQVHVVTIKHAATTAASPREPQIGQRVTCNTCLTLNPLCKVQEQMENLAHGAYQVHVVTIKHA